MDGRAGLVAETAEMEGKIHVSNDDDEGSFVVMSEKKKGEKR